MAGARTALEFNDDETVVVVTLEEFKEEKALHTKEIRELITSFHNTSEQIQAKHVEEKKALAKTLADEQDKFKQLGDHVDSLVKKQLSLEAEVSELTKELSEVSSKNKELELSHGKVSFALGGAGLKLARMEETFTNYEQQLQEKEDSIQSLTAQNGSLHDTIQLLKKQYATIQGELVKEKKRTDDFMHLSQRSVSLLESNNLQLVRLKEENATLSKQKKPTESYAHVVGKNTTAVRDDKNSLPKKGSTSQNGIFKNQTPTQPHVTKNTLPTKKLG